MDVGGMNKQFGKRQRVRAEQREVVRREKGRYVGDRCRAYEVQ